MAFMIQARGEWAGSLLSKWSPAVTGGLNQTHMRDEEASTFETEGAAEDFLANFIEASFEPRHGDDEENARARDKVEFRIVEVES